MDFTAREFLQAREAEFIAWGLPKAEVQAAKDQIADFEGEGSHSWYEFWRGRSNDAAVKQNWVEASLYLGAAKYPMLGTNALGPLIKEQTSYLMRAGLSVERHLAIVAVDTISSKVPYHLYGRRHLHFRRCIYLCGGLDTYKAELHAFAEVLAKWCRCAVIVFEMPGTGETPAIAAGFEDKFLSSFINASMPVGAKACFVGISFGGYWALRVAFSRSISSAVDLGGPAGLDLDHKVAFLNLPAEMRYIVSAVLGRGSPQLAVEILQQYSEFLRTKMIETPVPILAINGREDPYVPLRDVEFLKSYANAEVVLVPNASHCAVERIRYIAPKIVHWISITLAHSSLRTRLAGLISRVSIGQT